jgi:hypothetical protein
MFVNNELLDGGPRRKRAFPGLRPEFPDAGPPVRVASVRLDEDPLTRFLEDQ